MLRSHVCGALILIILLGSVLPPAFLAKDETVEEIGDILQIALPLAAWGSTFIAGAPDGGLWDKEGTKQATLSIGSALATMTAAKYIIAKTRPGRFPALHVSLRLRSGLSRAKQDNRPRIKRRHLRSC